MYFSLRVIFIFYFFTIGYLVEGFGLLQNVQYPDKCLHVKGSSTANNGDLEIVNCDSSSADQQLNVENWSDYANNPGQIIFQFNQKCLTVNVGGISNGDIINQYECWQGAANQLWRIVGGSYDGNFQLQNVGSSRCLTAEGGGTYTDQWDCAGESGAPHQTWRIRQTDNVVFIFENAQHVGKCLNAVNGVGGTSSSLNIVDCDTTSTSQLFNTKDLSIFQDFGIINFDGTNLCLNVYGESQSNGGQIGSYTCSNPSAENEKWRLKVDAWMATVFQILSSSSGKCLTSENGGTSIDQWDCTDYATAPHQWWKLKIVSSSSLAQHDSPGSRTILESAAYPNNCLRIQSGSRENNAEFQLVSCDEFDDAQVLNMNALAWDTLSSTPGSISFQRSSKCLTISGASVDNGGRANQYDCVSPLPTNQQWKLITANNDGNADIFELQNTGSGKCLTAEGGGAYLDQWDCYSFSGAPHQFWRKRIPGGDRNYSFFKCDVDTIRNPNAAPDHCHPWEV